MLQSPEVQEDEMLQAKELLPEQLLNRRRRLRRRLRRSLELLCTAHDLLCTRTDLLCTRTVVLCTVSRDSRSCAAGSRRRTGSGPQGLTFKLSPDRIPGSRGSCCQREPGFFFLPGHQNL